MIVAIRWVRQLHPIQDPPLRLTLPAWRVPLKAKQPTRISDVHHVVVDLLQLLLDHQLVGGACAGRPRGLMGQSGLQ